MFQHVTWYSPTEDSDATAVRTSDLMKYVLLWISMAENRNCKTTFGESHTYWTLKLKRRNTVKRHNKHFKDKRENSSLYKSLITRVPCNEYPTTDSWLNFKQFQFNWKWHNTNLYLW